MPTPSDQRLDVFDEYAHVVTTARRAEVRQLRGIFRVVHLWVWSSVGELLLQRIGPDAPHAGMWGSSAAGYVWAGETQHDAMLRTVRAELGIAPWLEYRSETRRRDGEAIKTIRLYETRHDGPFEPLAGHVAEVRFWEVDRIAEARLRDKFQFTPTLLHLLDTFYPGR